MHYWPMALFSNVVTALEMEKDYTRGLAEAWPEMSAHPYWWGTVIMVCAYFVCQSAVWIVAEWRKRG